MRVLVYVGTSLDGLIAGKGGDIDWLLPFQNEEVGESYKNFMSSIDAVVIGKGTFDTLLSFPAWPYEQKVFLLSSSVSQPPKHLSEKVTVLSMKPREVLKHLSDKGFLNVYVDGGKVIQGFLKEDCIDELNITKVPVILGSGVPLFGALDNVLQFDHIETSVFSNGLVKSRYKRNRT